MFVTNASDTENKNESLKVIFLIFSCMVEGKLQKSHETGSSLSFLSLTQMRKLLTELNYYKNIHSDIL